MHHWVFAALTSASLVGPLNITSWRDSAVGRSDNQPIFWWSFFGCQICRVTFDQQSPGETLMVLLDHAGFTLTLSLSLPERSCLNQSGHDESRLSNQHSTTSTAQTTPSNLSLRSIWYSPSISHAANHQHSSSQTIKEVSPHRGRQIGSLQTDYFYLIFIFRFTD